MKYIKNKLSNALPFALSLILISGTAWCKGGTPKTVIELPETPLGEYEKKKLPPLRKELPLSFSLKENHVKDQGPIGTCAIFTAIGCYEQHHSSKPMSEAEFAVYAETQIDNCKAGINMGKVLKLGQSMGFVEEDRLSYDDKYLPYVARTNGIDTSENEWKEILKNKKHPSICVLQSKRREAYNATMRAMKVSLELDGVNDKTSNRLGSLYGLHHVTKRSLDQDLRSFSFSFGSMSIHDEYEKQEGAIGKPGETNLKKIKRAIALGFPVAVAAAVYNNCWSPKKEDDYIIKMPTAQDERTGSHAFMLTGYKSSDKGDYFRVRNSWGQRWGDRGYAWISGEYLKRYATEVVAISK